MVCGDGIGERTNDGKHGREYVFRDRGPLTREQSRRAEQKLKKECTPLPRHLERTKTLCTSMILATIESIEKDRSNT